MRKRKVPGLSGLLVNTLKEWYKGMYPDQKDLKPNKVYVENWEVIRKIVTECFDKYTAATAF